jgi:hypothetical protein
MHGHGRSIQELRLLVQPHENGITHPTVDIDPLQLDQLRELPELVATHIHMEFKRCRVFMIFQ